MWTFEIFQVMFTITLCEVTLITVQSWQYELWYRSIKFSKNRACYA